MDTVQELVFGAALAPLACWCRKLIRASLFLPLSRSAHSSLHMYTHAVTSRRLPRQRVLTVARAPFNRTACAALSPLSFRGACGGSCRARTDAVAKFEDMRESLLSIGSIVAQISRVCFVSVNLFLIAELLTAF